MSNPNTHSVTDFNSQDVVSKYDIYPLIHHALGRPAMIEFIGEVKDKRVLDLGCGTGEITFELHKRGAKCQGVDFSQKFVELATARHPEVNYSVGDARSLSFMPSASLDIVVMSMVILGIDSESDISQMFAECARILVPGGHFIFSHIHPLMMQRFKDSFREVQLDKDWHYFQRGSIFKVTTMLTDRSSMTFTDAHWSLTALSELLEQHGFVISALKEPQITPDNEHFETLKDELQVPYYVFFRTRKA